VLNVGYRSQNKLPGDEDIARNPVNAWPFTKGVNDNKRLIRTKINASACFVENRFSPVQPFGGDIVPNPANSVPSALAND
jgi:hypothetical protein